MVDLKKAAMVALGVTGISYGLGWVYQKFFAKGIATITFSAVDVNVGQQIQAGVNSTLAGKILSYFQGVIPVGEGIMALITLYLASFIIVAGGAWIGERIAFGKTDTIRFGFGMGIAALVVGLVVGSMEVSIGAIGAGIAMLIYFTIIAFVYGLARKIEGVKDFLPIP